MYLTEAEIATLAAVLASTATNFKPLGIGSIGLAPGLAGRPGQFPSIRQSVPGTLGHPEW